MTRYFAYGSNMDSTQMAMRCAGHELYGVALLAGWRFRIMRRGYATVVPEPESSVWGLLWELGDDDVASLDRYEGVAGGLYTKETLPVRKADGEQVDTLVYVATDQEPGRPDDRYMARIVDAARAAGLPGDYVAELETWRR